MGGMIDTLYTEMARMAGQGLNRRFGRDESLGLGMTIGSSAMGRYDWS